MEVSFGDSATEGDLAIDLVNTLYPGAPDGLARFADAVRLVRASNVELLGDARSSKARQERALARVRHLRETIRAILETLRAGKSASATALERLNDVLATCSIGARIVRSNGGYARMPVYRFNAPDDILIPLADAALRLLVEKDASRIKTCPGCGMFLYDASKNRTRNWCSMKTCGNRAKAARHYRRKHANE
ncbi:MAG TPA: CGNR zinc finger domain-containing protein [Candidatus Baltobacteraceae bacterium]|jgi:predicted RNA-binding Zn ribbon-like protein